MSGTRYMCDKCGRFIPTKNCIKHGTESVRPIPKGGYPKRLGWHTRNQYAEWTCCYCHQRRPGMSVRVFFDGKTYTKAACLRHTIEELDRPQTLLRFKGGSMLGLTTTNGFSWPPPGLIRLGTEYYERLTVDEPVEMSVITNTPASPGVATYEFRCHADAPEAAELVQRYQPSDKLP